MDPRPETYELNEAKDQAHALRAAASPQPPASERLRSEELETPHATQRIWSPLKLITFRLLFIYFVLYTFPFPLGRIPGLESVDAWTTKTWQTIVPVVAKNVLGINHQLALPGGSGDTTFNYVQVLIIFATAAVTCLLWSVLVAIWSRAVKPWRSHRYLGELLYIGCRYYLALTMFGYGFAKIFKSQFPAPHLSRLLEPYGDSSPMGLLWTFMGQSTGYTIFAGAAEVLGGLLLLCRRTTTFGAFVTLGVMVNVAMMNFCYDVPVKLYSMHLVAMALGLLLLDWRRLANVFILNRPAPSVNLDPPGAYVWLTILRWLIKIGFIGWLLYQQISGSIAVQKQWGDRRPKPPLYGIHDVTTYVVDGETIPPLTTRDTRWENLIIDYPNSAIVRLMNGQMMYYAFEVDAEKGTVTFGTRGPNARNDTLAYTEPEPGKLVIKGNLGDHEIQVEMTERNLDSFLLRNRGFHWINEYPYNR